MQGALLFRALLGLTITLTSAAWFAPHLVFAMVFVSVIGVWHVQL